MYLEDLQNFLQKSQNPKEVKFTLAFRAKYQYNVKETYMEEKRIELSDDYMFSTIMRGDKEICRKVLETILGFEIEDLEYVKDEEYLKSDVDSHAIRLDVIAKNTGAVYDVEMQKARVGDIRKRMRYYQSQIDVSELPKAESYKKLKDSYIIFICTFDLFEKGAYVYRFENYDRENDIALGDGAKKIVINTKGVMGDISDELRELITYIEKPEEARKGLTSELVVELDEKVTSQNKDEDWREAQMKAEADRVDYIDYGIAVGMERGLSRGKTEGYDIARQVFKLSLAGKSVGQIAQELGMDEGEVNMILG